MKLKFKKEQIKKIVKIAIVLMVILAVSFGVFGFLQAFGLTDIKKLQTFIEGFGHWGVVVFMTINVLSTVLLCFVPAVSMTFITLGVVLYGANIKTFVICFSCVFISSILMDLVGRFGGVKAIKKLIGEKDYNEAKDLVKEKGMVYVPFMYLLPIFPDDAICMVCGATKIKFWLHCLYILICRGIGCGTIVFGIDLLPEEVTTFTSTNPWDYLRVLAIIVFGLALLVFIARRLDKWLTAKMRKSGAKL